MPGAVHAVALTSAVLLAMATIFIRHGLRNGDAATGFWISVVVGTVGLWMGVVLTGGTGPVSAVSAVFFVLAGLIGTMGGRLLRFVAIDRVGPSTAVALINLNPLIAAAIAILLLGERAALATVVGTVAIVLGTVLLSASGHRAGFRPRDLALPLLSAVCFGLVAILRKLGLAGAGALTGSAINVTTALVAYGAFLLASGRRDVLAWRSEGVLFFVAAGVAENAAVLLYIVALGMGTVSVVAPLYGASPIFVLIFSFFFLRGVEVLTRRVVGGTVLIVLGVYLVTAWR